MADELNKKALFCASNLLNHSFKNEKEAFEKILNELKNLIEITQSFLFYFNTDRLNLQYSMPEIKLKEAINLRADLKEKLYSKNEIEFDKNSAFIKNLHLKKTDDYYILTKLNLRGTIFGGILLAKKIPFTKEEIQIIQCFTNIVAYVIKDAEVSNVVKTQFKALQENIIERNEAYKTIEKQNAKILEADKAKNEFLANITHELRSPLNAIIGFAQMLQEKLFGELNEKQSEYVNDINVSAIHLLGMINEILDLSKIEAKAMNVFVTEFDSFVCLNEVINILKPLINKKSIKIINSIKENTFIHSDFQKIQQILYNLLSNAIKFTPENGQIEIGSKIEKNKFIFFVKDNGIGIDKKYHGKIFAKFVQLESAFTKKESSTGLGLTITKELTELLKGKISLESKVNEGSNFIVEISKKLPKE